MATARYIDEDETGDAIPQNATEGTSFAFQSKYISPTEEIHIPPASDPQLSSPNSIVDLRNLGVISPPDSGIVGDPTLPAKYKINGDNNPFSRRVSYAHTVWFEVSNERSVCNFLPYRQ